MMGQYACRDVLETGRWSQNSIEGRAAIWQQEIHGASAMVA
jgi:hypothetical protein